MKSCHHALFVMTLALCLDAPMTAVAQDSFGGNRKPAPQQPAQQPVAPAAAPARGHSATEAMEMQDFGVAPQSQLHNGSMHGPTPTRIPGGTVITTQALAALLKDGSGALVFDVLGGSETLPNALQAAWIAQPGSFSDPVQQQLVHRLQARVQGRRDTPLVFYCASTQCWMSYNAALRAINAGYTQVMWYRGGIEAWKAAGLPTMQAGR